MLNTLLTLTRLAAAQIPLTAMLSVVVFVCSRAVLGVLIDDADRARRVERRGFGPR